MCLENFSSQKVERHNKPEIEVIFLLNTILLSFLIKCFVLSDQCRMFKGFRSYLGQRTGYWLGSKIRLKSHIKVRV